MRIYDNVIAGNFPDRFSRFSGAIILFLAMLIYWQKR
jgi:hypothetical protein